MKFSSEQKKIFKKNLNALHNPSQDQLFEENLRNLNSILQEKLNKIKNTHYELILSKDNLDINLKDKRDSALLYKNTLQELNTMLNTYNEKYALYPVLYFYGFGNGILFKALLQNQNLKHIVVFEKELEIIWLMFHLVDFSQELKANKLILLDVDSLKLQDYHDLCSCNPFFSFSRVYFLELSSDYYEKYQEEILEVNNNLMKNFRDAILDRGNDPLDALQGIEQFVYTLPKMITHPSLTTLLQKRSNLSDTAIIVSTGPSLTKQLPLLKEYASKATIFCADSAYPILAKHGIKPDYVCSLERVFHTSEYFNNDFKEFDKDILFILASLVHPRTIGFLESNDRDYLLFQRTLDFQFYLCLEEFKFLFYIPSVAHVAYTIATFLEHKNIILIGQDLAYGKDGKSHSSEYTYLTDAGEKGEYYKKDAGKYTTLAYGGEEFVESSFAWLLFKNFLEKLIQGNSSSATYNCTEGGVRIEGTIEKPFKEVCETLLTQDLNKPFPKIEPLSYDKQ
ncbi:motility associated factor glycosyltransferase family protein, partial [Campylobacter aviculae]